MGRRITGGDCNANKAAGSCRKRILSANDAAAYQSKDKGQVNFFHDEKVVNVNGLEQY